MASPIPKIVALEPTHDPNRESGSHEHFPGPSKTLFFDNVLCSKSKKGSYTSPKVLIIWYLTVLGPANPAQCPPKGPPATQTGGGWSRGDRAYVLDSINQIPDWSYQGSDTTHLGDLKCPQWVIERDPGRLRRHRQSTCFDGR